MNAEDEQERSEGGLVWVTYIAIVAFLYVVSIGPASLVVKGKPNGAAIVRTVYFPVVWLHDHTILRQPLNVYVDLWVGR